jgi:hypothetical protein
VAIKHPLSESRIWSEKKLLSFSVTKTQLSNPLRSPKCAAVVLAPGSNFLGIIAAFLLYSLSCFTALQTHLSKI